MVKSAQINSRVEPELKADAEAVLKEIGLSTSDAITMFLRQVVMHRGLPFEARIPNAETVAALREGPSTLRGYTSSKDLMKDILDDAG